MNIAIVGAGAMGGLFGARLALNGQKVSFIEVAPATIAAISDNGLAFSDDSGTHTVRVPVGRADSFAEPFDLIVFFTKSLHTQSAVRSISHLVGQDTWALSVQNGLGNAEIISEVVPSERIIVGMTNLPADLQSAGVVHSHGEGYVRIWTMSGKERPEVSRVAEIFSAAGLNCSADPQVRAAIWEKVAFNAALNSVCAVIGCTVGTAGSTEQGRALAMRIAAETVSVAQALQIPARMAKVEEALLDAFRMHVNHKPSMLQDIEAGRQTEIDFINGAVAEQARGCGVSVPTVTALYELVKMKQEAVLNRK
ncbi:2-dehydropantoate 2-reductase [Herbaspirillum sp. GW103]|uniref:ketopantoate reductase family protein n=1 Tax=Herbaspirillum sp. GW103 TaxID=1175306 RepID=UPI00025E43CF|nr:2-dehydropantoate 2-reductase [Herbaspirillum sp. GW103]EIJ45499.1 2-dehydropantoate 2-reductase [Herbaspirillum sp. GW103]